MTCNCPMVAGKDTADVKDRSVLLTKDLSLGNRRVVQMEGGAAAQARSQQADSAGSADYVEAGGAWETLPSGTG